MHRPPPTSSASSAAAEAEEGPNEDASKNDGAEADPERLGLFSEAKTAETTAVQLTSHPKPEVLATDNRMMSKYRFAGRFLSKALFDGHSVAPHLACPLYSHLLGLPLCFEDLRHLDPELHHQLNLLRDMDPEAVAGLTLDFTATYDMQAWGASGTETVTLRDQGHTMDVDGTNRDDYINRRWKRRVLEDTAPQLGAFLRGFYDVIPPALLMVFQPEELEQLMCGTRTIDVKDWRAHTVYLGAFKPSSMLRQTPKVVQWFWEVVSDFDEVQKRRLLRFVTGSAGVPVGGFARLLGNDGKISLFTLQPVESDAAVDTEVALLPRAHTCFNRLDLPSYRSKQQLREVLTHVIETDLAITGFDMD